MARRAALAGFQLAYLGAAVTALLVVVGLVGAPTSLLATGAFVGTSAVTVGAMALAGVTYAIEHIRPTDRPRPPAGYPTTPHTRMTARLASQAPSRQIADAVRHDLTHIAVIAAAGPPPAAAAEADPDDIPF